MWASGASRWNSHGEEDEGGRVIVSIEDALGVEDVRPKPETDTIEVGKFSDGD